jgi:amino acid adenylation domain-containing protein
MGTNPIKPSIREAHRALRPYPHISPGIAAADSAPLSTMQEQLWFMVQVHKGLSAFCTAEAFRIRGPLNLSAFDQTLTEVLRVHQALRTNIRLVGGQPRQVVAPLQPFHCELADFRGSATAEEDAWKFSSEFVRRPIDVSTDLPLRAAVAHIAQDDQILILMNHHAFFDGISIEVYLPAIAAAYRALLRGLPPDLPPPPVEYRDFAVWNQDFVAGPKGQRQIAYWIEQLRSIPLLDLPTDKPRPFNRDLHGTVITWELSEDLTAALAALAKSESSSVFVILVAALEVVLHRYTGQEDFAVGTMFANRPRPELKRVIGMFTNEIVLRADLSGDPTLSDLLKRVKETFVWASLHQDAPFAKIIETLKPVRSPGRNPLFDVLISQQREEWESFDLEGCEVKSIPPLPCDDGVSEYDIAIYATEGGAQLHGSIDYATDLYEEATIRRLWEHIHRVLEAAVRDAAQRVSEIDVLSNAERDQLLVAWNRTGAEYPQETISALFEAQAERTPEATALIEADRSVTFRELNSRANQLARYLRELGVKAEEPVGVSLQRSADSATALLGILKAGAAWVPLDPLYPADRLEYMLRDAGIRTHLTLERLTQQVPHVAQTLVCLDRVAAELALQSIENPNVPATPDSMAYIIYTSGSTGRPKGVEGLHRGAVNRFAWMWRTYPFTADEVCCARASLNFVDSVWEQFGPLLQGVPVVLVSDETARDPHALVTLLEQHAVTRMVLVPSLLRQILEASAENPEALAKVRYVVSSGEALSQELVAQFYIQLPHAKLLNLYGSTEVSADSTYYETKPGDEQALIGRPIANTQCYVLDARRHPVPLGAKGELYVAGDGLARGYHGQPQMTADRFVPNPFSSHPGDRLYRTGDLAKYRNDGQIEYLGRADYQVKIRGFRIELGEIETVLAQHPRIVQTTVIVREDVPGELRLVAYAVTKEKATDAAALIADLRRHLEELLPDYMIPAAIVILAAMPLTPNGKIDRLSFPKPESGDLRTAKDFIEPRSEMEKKIAAVWRDILHLEKVGVDDNFFDSGGHSLLMMRVYGRLRPLADRPLTVTDLFRYPTIRALARFLGESPAGTEKGLTAAQDRAARQLEALQRRKPKAPRPGSGTPQ